MNELPPSYEPLIIVCVCVKIYCIVYINIYM